MIPAVVVSLVLVTSTIALPLTTQGIETPQIQSGIPLTVLPQQFEKTGIETPTGQTTQTEQYTTQVEKTGYQTPPQAHLTQQQNTAVPKVENVPVNVEEVQQVYPQNPVLLPVQPLSVVPFNPTGQVLRPIVVPAEAIADGRVIITPIGQIQQRNFQQDVYVVPESQVSQPTNYAAVPTQGVESNQQTYYVQPTGQSYPSQEQFHTEQQVPTTVVKHTAEPVQNTYQVQQPVITETAEKVNSQQVYNVQESSEKQVPQQTYTGAPIVVENVEKQVPYQQSTGFQTQNVQTTHQQQVYEPQTVEKQAEHQQVTGYSPVEVGFAAEGTEKQGQYQQGYSQTQQKVEKQAVQQVPVQSVPVQPVPVQPVHQHQVYSVQPEPVQHQVPYHVESVQQQVVKTTEVEPNQQVTSVQPQQVTNYAVEPVHNFGEKLPQVQHHVPVQTLSSVPHTQETSVQTSVSSTQE